MKKIWHLKEIESHEISRLNSELKISDTLSKVFINRGIKSKKEAQDFFLPTLEKLPNPFLMEGVKKSGRGPTVSDLCCDGAFAG